MQTLPGDFNLNDATCILKFSAEWCGPCKAVTPLLERISTELEVEVYDIDVDENTELSAKFNIRSIPAVIGMKNGKPVDALVGTYPYDKYKDLAERLIAAD